MEMGARMTDPLPPCPFCGCDQIKTSEHGHGGKPFRRVSWYQTDCQGCGANTTADTAEVAEMKWRRRTP